MSAPLDGIDAADFATGGLLAVVPVRDGLPSGGAEVVAEAGGRAILVGRRCMVAASELEGVATRLGVWETGLFQPAAWARTLAPLLDATATWVLPASPDGRDLAPRLAHASGRRLVTGACRVVADEATVVRHGGRAEAAVALDEPAVVTFAPGSRTVQGAHHSREHLFHIRPDATEPGEDLEVRTELPADPTTMDLAEADRIVGGGAGLGTDEVFQLLGAVGAAIGASLGATRVVTDAGWAPHERQIGTTGVEVDPGLYLAFGISGAVQHVMGLGDPDHIVAVNLDGACPMMSMADLAIVGDAPAIVAELAERLGLDVPAAGTPAGAGARVER